MEESSGPFLSLPAEMEHSCASILITAFALQWFTFPTLSSQEKGDWLLCFLLSSIFFQELNHSLTKPIG